MTEVNNKNRSFYQWLVLLPFGKLFFFENFLRFNTYPEAIG